MFLSQCFELSQNDYEILIQKEPCISDSLEISFLAFLQLEGTAAESPERSSLI